MASDTTCVLTCVGQAGNQIGGALLKRTGPWLPCDTPRDDADASTAASASTDDAGSAKSSLGRAAAVYRSALHRAVSTGKAAPARTAWTSSGSRSELRAGVVLIDSEPKVVRSLLSSASSPASLPFVTPSAVVYDQNGRGNNWAWGYTGVAGHRAKVVTTAGVLSTTRGEPLWQRAMTALRLQAEACDSFKSVLVCHSLGGGTGAGLGSRLLESIRAEYPRITLLSSCVAPFACGDTPLQYINMALTLATVHEVCDGVLFHDNDDLLQRSRVVKRHAAAAAAGGTVGSSSARRRAAQGEEDGISTRALNDVVAAALAGVVTPMFSRNPLLEKRVRKTAVGSRPAWVDPCADAAPAGEVDPLNFDASSAGDDRSTWMSTNRAGEASEATRDGLYMHRFRADDLVASLVPSPQLKYMDVRHASSSNSAASWMEVADALGDIIPRYDATGRSITSLAARIVARGASHVDCDSVLGDNSGPPPAWTRRGEAPHRAWTGLPATHDWALVASKLFRLYSLPPAAHVDALLSPGGVEKSLTLVSNGDGMLPCLLHCVERCEALVRAGAYMHWYERFGVTPGHIKAAAESVLDVVEAYGAAVPAGSARPARPAGAR